MVNDMTNRIFIHHVHLELIENKPTNINLTTLTKLSHFKC